LRLGTTSNGLGTVETHFLNLSFELQNRGKQAGYGEARPAIARRDFGGAKRRSIVAG